MFIRADIEPFKTKVWLSSPTMHEAEKEYIEDAFRKNWITTSGDNINELESAVSSYLLAGLGGEESRKGESLYAVGLATGTAAIHLALKLAGMKVNPGARFTAGLLKGQKVFVSDLTFNATVNPILYEGGEPVFIDSEYETWNMDPDALSYAFKLFPEVKIVVVANLYGTPANLYRIKEICAMHGAILIEDAAESFGATVGEKQTATFGDVGILSFNGNKIITGSAGGMLITPSLFYAEKVKKWSTQARESADWYQHEELGYNYRMSNIIAGVARGQMHHLDEHISCKKAIWERYRDGLKDLPVKMNPHRCGDKPNYWLSCMLIDSDYMAPQVRSEQKTLYTPTTGKSCPTEILEKLARFNAEGRPIWKPLHLQPLYRSSICIGKAGDVRAGTDAYIEHERSVCDEDIFERGVCLPSDIKMTEDEQNRVIEIIRSCFD